MINNDKNMKKKTSKIEFKLEDELFQKYKLLCDEMGQSMSKKLRNFIETEVNKTNYDYNCELERIKNISNEIVDGISQLYIDKDSIERQNEYFILRNKEFNLNLTSLNFLLFSNKKLFIISCKISQYSVVALKLCIIFNNNIRKSLKGIDDCCSNMDNFFKYFKI